MVPQQLVQVVQIAVQTGDAGLAEPRVDDRLCVPPPGFRRGEPLAARRRHRDHALARMIVESLDDDGYLRTPLEDLLPLVPVQPPATLEDLQLALAVVQSLEPAGVGARDVGECLQLQLPDITCPATRALAQRIVEV